MLNKNIYEIQTPSRLYSCCCLLSGCKWNCPSLTRGRRVVKLCCLLSGCNAKRFRPAKKWRKAMKRDSLIKQNNNKPSISAYNCPWTTQTQGKLQTGRAGQMPSIQIDIDSYTLHIYMYNLCLYCPCLEICSGHIEKQWWPQFQIALAACLGISTVATDMANRLESINWASYVQRV